MLLTVTPIFALILAIWLLLLSFRVIALRGGLGSFLISKKHKPVKQETLERAIRGHGNLTEYAPLFLVMMLIAELNQAPDLELILAGGVFSLGRFVHGLVFSFLPPNMFLRVGGMVLTFTGFFILIKTFVSFVF